MPGIPRFTLILSARAARDIDEAAAYIAHDSPANSVKWIDEVNAAIEDLAFLPSRFPAAFEAAKMSGDLRQMVVKSHRVVFEIRDRQVLILTVRHSARLPMTP